MSIDAMKQAIISLTDQCAALIQERDELQKQVWLYEKNGVTCQTYRHAIEQSCSECNVQMKYTAPRQWQGLRGEEIHYIASKVTPKMVNGMSFVPDWAIPFGKEIETKLREKNT